MKPLVPEDRYRIPSAQYPSRAAASIYRARTLLDELDAEDRRQRRVRWLAIKAVVSIREMRAVAAQTRWFSDRKQWEEEYRLVESILLKISKRGV